MRSALFPLALAMAGTATAQTMQAPVMGGMTSLEVGMEPMMHMATPAYVAKADASDEWTVATSRLALTRSRLPAVLAFARTAGSAHAASRRDRGGAAGTDAQLAQLLTALRSAPAAQFDAQFARAQLLVHRHAWALHSGYAADGPDVRLRRAAAAAVMLEERDLRALPLRPMPY